MVRGPNSKRNPLRALHLPKAVRPIHPAAHHILPGTVPLYPFSNEKLQSGSALPHGNIHPPLGTSNILTPVSAIAESGLRLSFEQSWFLTHPSSALRTSPTLLGEKGTL